jgi:hypothetical protein
VLYSVRRPVTALKPEELLELLENQSKYWWTSLIRRLCRFHKHKQW